jgi:AsmA protein
MKRHWFIAAVLAACGAFAAATPWTIPEATLGGQIAPQLASLAGLPSGKAANARFTLLPVPRLDISRLALRDAAGAVQLDVERLRGRVRLLPLVGGRIELTELTLFNPRLVYRDDGSADETLRRLATVLTPGGGTFNLPDVERLVMFDGRVEAKGAAGGRSVLLDSVQLIAGRGMTRDTYDLDGELAWRGERVKVQSFSLDVAALMEGRPAVTSGRVSGDVGAIDFAGRVTRLPILDVDGKLSVKTNSLKRLASWLSLPLPMTMEGPVDVQGALRLRDGDASLANAAVVLPSGRLEGALHLKDLRGRGSLSGTLAGDRLDLTEQARALGALRGADGGWSRDTIDPAMLPSGDVDLRVSAGRVAIGQAVLTNVACSLISRQGKTDFTLGGAEFHKGSLKGRISLAGAPRGFDLKAQASFDRVDTAAALATATDGRRISGIGYGTLQVEASGANAHAVVRSLEGKATLVVRQGDIVGINLPEVLRRMEKRPLSAALDVRGGRTPFELASLSARISRGVMDVQDGSVGSPAARIGFAGQVGLAERVLALSGIAQLVDAPAGREPVTLPFEVTGSFDDPMIVPDARSLMRRSGATSPFIDLRARRPETPVVPAGGDALAPN